METPEQENPTKGKKTTVSFHLSGEEKEQLTQQAIEKGGSITSYIHYKLFEEEAEQELTSAFIHKERGQHKQQIQLLQVDLEKSEKKLKVVTDKLEETEESLATVLSENEELEALKAKVSFYENDFLKQLYKENKGKTIRFTNGQGQEMEVLIKEIKDVYLVIINSFIQNS